MHPQVMVEKGTRDDKGSRALLSSQAKSQLCEQADQGHGYNSHAEPQSPALLSLSQETSRRPQVRSIAFNCVSVVPHAERDYQVVSTGTPASPVHLGKSCCQANLANLTHQNDAQIQEVMEHQSYTTYPGP